MRKALSNLLPQMLGRNNADYLKLLARGWRYRSIANYLKVDGWLRHAEAIALYEAARSLPDDAPVVCEIGCWLGRSAVVIGMGLREKRKPRFICIDPFNADGDVYSRPIYAGKQRSSARTLRERFDENMRSRGLQDMLEVLQGYSYDVRPNFREQVDLLFIDGNHDYEDVRRDYLEWHGFVKPGGVLAMHDVDLGRPDFGPTRVVHEMIYPDPQWTGHQHAQALFLCCKKA